MKQLYKNLEGLLEKRALPPLKSKAEMLEIMQRQVYGRIPPVPTKMEWTEEIDKTTAFAGKAVKKTVTVTSHWGDKSFSFPVCSVIPKGDGPHPFFIHINFSPNVPDKYMPTEEIIDHGYAVLSFCYQDVTSDDSNFASGLCGVYYDGKERDDLDPGKIAFWAWAGQRVMDYAQTIDLLDKERSIVCGHSRLGKTALLCGATDERFKFVYSNNSGANGAAVTRDKIGEKLKDSFELVPYWYCKDYARYVNNEHAMPFDQHYLLACIAPRYLYVASATEDAWADPDSEMLCCVATTPAYNALGLNGIVCNDRLPQTGDVYHDGYIGYHMRAGEHFFSREDWQKVIAFVDKKTGKN